MIYQSCQMDIALRPNAKPFSMTSRYGSLTGGSESRCCGSGFGDGNSWLLSRSRWSPRWPVLDGLSFSSIAAAASQCRPLLNSHQPPRDARWSLTFTDVTAKAGLAGAGYGMGVAVGDYDNDGRPDLYLSSLTSNQLFHNNGDGTLYRRFSGDRNSRASGTRHGRGFSRRIQHGQTRYLVTALERQTFPLFGFTVSSSTFEDRTA